MGNANSSSSSRRSKPEMAVERNVEAISSGPVAPPGMPVVGRAPVATGDIVSPRPSAPATAHIGQNNVQYSDGFESPEVELNVNVPTRKSRQAGAASVKNMGNYPAPYTSKLSNEERFAMSSRSRSASMGGQAGLPLVGNNSSLAMASPTTSTPRSNGPHSRRHGTLDLTVSVKDGDNVPVLRRTTDASKSAVTFGSINDAVVPIPSSPPSALPVRSATESVKTFGSVGSVAVQNGASKAAFTRPSSRSSTSHISASTTTVRSSTPRSKALDASRPFQGPSKMWPTPPSAGASVAPGHTPPATSSPRFGPHPVPHPGQTAGMPPQTPPAWQGYYYGYTPPPEQYMAPAMSEVDALTKKIGEDTKAFFSTRSLDEGEEYFSTLPQEHRLQLVGKLSMQAVESKEADAQLVADLFTRVREKNLVSAASFEEGLMPLAEIIDNVAIHAPEALYLFVIMLKGAGLHEDEERRARMAAKSMEGDKLRSLLALDVRVDYWHEVQFKRQIFRDIAEFFRLRLVSEAETYFVNLPPMHRPFLIRRLAEQARISSLDADLAVDLFRTVRRKGLCSHASFEYGLGLLEGRYTECSM